MTFWEILLLSLALAMDCFSVSLASGLILKKAPWGTTFRMALLFGLFQALMPLAGWLAIHYFQASVEQWDHWIAFGLLGFIGARMIRDAFVEEEDKSLDPLKLRTQLLLAVATSIDALAVGISLSCTGYDSLRMLWTPLAVIGAVSFLLSIAGAWIGARANSRLPGWVKPELLGGIILFGIGVRILIAHLGA